LQLLVICIGLLLLSGRANLLAAEDAAAGSAPQRAFELAKQERERHPDDPEAAWHFARATFDLADTATQSSDRAEIAQQGISACTEALVKAPDSAPLHYYLALNQGQLARTRSLGALKLVDQMEIEFTKAIALNASFDYAGPERSIGLLYRDAPAWASIGNRTKARQHLQRAIQLEPEYPENRLILIETALKWGDRKGARQELKLLEDSWHHAHARYEGPAWARSWSDWEARLDKIKKTLDETPRLEAPRH